MVTGTAEVIVTVGGEDDKVVLRSVESFDPVTNQWKNLACLPFAVSKHGLVVSGKIQATADGTVFLLHYVPSECHNYALMMRLFSSFFSLGRLYSVFGGR